MYVGVQGRPLQVSAQQSYDTPGRLCLPRAGERTGSGKEELFTQVQPSACARTVLQEAQPQPGPRHHLRLTERTNEGEFLSVTDDVSRSVA